METKEALSEFPRFQGFDPSVVAKSSPPNRLLRRRHSTKQFERSDFVDSTITPPVQEPALSLASDASTPTDPLDPILPNSKKRLVRRKSDTAIIARNYRNLDDTPTTPQRSSRLRKNQPENLKTSNLNTDNNNPAPMSCPSKNMVEKSVFDDILRIKETFDDSKPTTQKKVTKVRRQLHVDEFDESPKIITEKNGNSDGEYSRDGIREWETSPRKSDLHRSLRNQKDLDAF